MESIQCRANFRKINTRKEVWQTALLKKTGFVNPLDNLPKDYVQVTEWVQLTGVKDRLNREIWEGDIVKITNPKNQIQKMELICVVQHQWYGWSFVVYKVNKWEGFNVDPVYPDPVPFLYIAWTKTLEVIGNFYDNPELIETESPITL